MAESGLLYGENWTTRDVRKWPTLFYQLHGDPITTSAGLLTVTNGFSDLQISQVSTVFNDSNEILWEITVTNLGPDTAYGVVIKDPLASSTKFLNASGSIEPILKGKWILFNVGSIDANEYVTVAVRVSIIRDVDSIKNTATVSTINVDDNLTNNSTEVELLVPGTLTHR